VRTSRVIVVAAAALFVAGSLLYVLNWRAGGCRRALLRHYDDVIVADSISRDRLAAEFVPMPESVKPVPLGDIIRLPWYTFRLPVGCQLESVEAGIGGQRAIAASCVRIVAEPPVSRDEDIALREQLWSPAISDLPECARRQVASLFAMDEHDFRVSVLGARELQRAQVEQLDLADLAEYVTRARIKIALALVPAGGYWLDAPGVHGVLCFHENPLDNDHAAYAILQTDQGDRLFLKFTRADRDSVIPIVRGVIESFMLLDRPGEVGEILPQR
jgi:hypothetical protein